MKRPTRARLAAGCLAALLCSAAHASLIGQTLRFQRLAPTIDTPVDDPSNGNHRVGSGVEIADAFQNTFAIDVQADAMVLTFRDLGLASRPFVGFSFADAFGALDDFAAFTVSAASTRPFDPSRLAFDADHLWVNLAGLNFTRGDRLVFDIALAAPPSPVPEPATPALVLLGLAAALAATRRGAAR